MMQVYCCVCFLFRILYHSKFTLIFKSVGFAAAYCCKVLLQKQWFCNRYSEYISTLILFRKESHCYVVVWNINEQVLLYIRLILCVKDDWTAFKIKISKMFFLKIFRNHNLMVRINIKHTFWNGSELNYILKYCLYHFSIWLSTGCVIGKHTYISCKD